MKKYVVLTFYLHTDVNGNSTLHMAAILRTSSEHPKLRDVRRQVASLGSTGIADRKEKIII